MPWKSPLEDGDVLSLLMEHFPGLLFVKDSDYRILAANERFLSLYPPEQRDHVLGSTTLEDYPAEQRRLFLAQDLKALTEGESEVVERVDFPGGETRTVLSKKVGKTGPDGKRYLIGASVDITELEDTRNEAAQLWELIEHTSAEIVILEEKTLRILRMSSEAMKNLGLDAGQVRSFQYAELLTPALISSFLEIRRRLQEDPSVRHHMSGTQVRVDGSEYEVQAQVLRGRLSATEVIVVVAQDVTEENRRKRTLTRQNDALLEFAYRVSHDLRSPVLSSVGLINVAKEMLGAGDTQAAVELLTRTTKVLTQAEKLATDLLTLTEIEELQPKPEEISLSKLVSKSQERSRLLFGRGLEFRVELGGVDQIISSRKPLLWILDNLFSNAMKYRDRECAQSWVCLRARRVGDSIELLCTDNGVGVAPEYQGKLFGMFQRFHPRMAPGSGLGLFMVRRAAIRLGGGADFVPTDTGACFKVTLSERADQWS